MLKIRKWFYDKAKGKMEYELIESGLSIIDEDKFHKKVKSASKRDIIYTFILVALTIILIFKWVVV